MFLHVPTVGIMLMFGAVTSAGSVVVAPAVAVFVMAGVCIAHTPYAAFKEYGILLIGLVRDSELISTYTKNAITTLKIRF